MRGTPSSESIFETKTGLAPFLPSKPCAPFSRRLSHSDATAVSEGVGHDEPE
jgi:hypothetical protein